MEPLINNLLAHPFYIVIGVFILIFLIYSVVKKIVKLILYTILILIAFLAYVHYTGGDTMQAIESIEKEGERLVK